MGYFALLKNDFQPHISPLGNPAMPMKMPFGPGWFQNMEWNIPHFVMYPATPMQDWPIASRQRLVLQT